MDMIYYHDLARYKYRLSRPYATQVALYGRAGGSHFIEIDDKGRLRFASGYAWDGPSGPTVDTPGAMRPSLIHDGLYQLIGLGILPAEAKDLADQILKQTYVQDAMLVIKHGRELELAARAEGRWLGGMRDWWSDRRYNALVAAVHVRAEAWYVAVQTFGSGGEHPPELTAPL